MATLHIHQPVTPLLSTKIRADTINLAIIIAEQMIAEIESAIEIFHGMENDKDNI